MVSFSRQVVNELGVEQGARSMYWYVDTITRPSFGTGPNVFTAQANRKGDEIAQVASYYSPVELAYFKVLVRLRCHPLLNLALIRLW